MDPVTREEMFLAAAAGESVTLPTPVTRTEIFLKKIAENAGGLSDEQIAKVVRTYLDENGVSMNSLTITGAVEATYDGSEAVTVEIPQGGSGGGETAAEALLATGVLSADTPSLTLTETGVTLGDLKKYKRFAIVVDGASNTVAHNLLFQFSAQTYTNIMYRHNIAGAKAQYEWLDDAHTLLNLKAQWSGNPSLANAGSSLITSTIGNISTNSVVGGGAVGLLDYSGLDDSQMLYLCNATTTSIDYTWEIRGLTV